MKEQIKEFDEKIFKMYQAIGKWPLDIKRKYADIALDMLGDYPLYSATSNIGCEEAILIALVLFGDEFYKEVK